MTSSVKSKAIRTKAPRRSRARGDGGASLASLGPLATTDSVFAGRWANPRTGAGTDSDKGTGTEWIGGAPLHEAMLESLLEKNDLAYAVASALPEWGLRHGFELTLESPGDATEPRAIESAVRARLDELKAHQSMLEAATWGLGMGGGLILIGAVDGLPTDKPLDLERLDRVEWLRVSSRRDVQIYAIEGNPQNGRYGEPVKYRVNELIAGTSVDPQIWHHSRVIRYGGALTSKRTRATNHGWDLSVLDRMYGSLALHDGLWGAVGAMMADGSQGVWSILGLFAAATSGKFDQIQARFKIADESRSMFNAILLDAEKEKFEYVHRQFGGLDGLLAQSAIRTAAGAQQPVTVLYGQSPAGMNATGESDIRLWYDRVESYQEDDLRPALERVIELLFRSKSGPTGGVEPTGWKATFRPVRKATPMEDGELRARQAQIDGQYIGDGVLAPVEVRRARFTPHGWSSTTNVNPNDPIPTPPAPRAPDATKPGSGPAGQLGTPSSTGPSQAPKT